MDLKLDQGLREIFTNVCLFVSFCLFAFDGSVE